MLSLRNCFGLLVLICLFSAFACGGAQSGTNGEAEMRALSEPRAMEVIVRVLAAEHQASLSGWRVALTAHDFVAVDARIGHTNFGIEWVTDQDRADLGGALPSPLEGQELQIVRGHGESRDAHLLLLHDSAYQYAPLREDVHGGAAGAMAAESRLARDVRDFLHHMRANL